MGSRFLCPHCSRSGGRPGSPFTGELVCLLCSKDFKRVRELMMVARRIRPGAAGTPPVMVARLLIKWCEIEGETVGGDAVRFLMGQWEQEDEASEAEQEAKRERDQRP